MVSIHIARVRTGPPVRLRVARLVAGHGIEGDRYWSEGGTFSKASTPDNQVTLIEEEALVAVARDYGVTVKPGETRRNIVTRGVALNHLVGRPFRVGGALLEGLELCEPCGHLAKLTTPRLREALVHRGGLRCRIVESGEARPGDAIDVSCPDAGGCGGRSVSGPSPSTRASTRPATRASTSTKSSTESSSAGSAAEKAPSRAPVRQRRPRR